MITFSKKEIKYIKLEFNNTKLKIEACSKEEVLELIESMGGGTIDTVLFLSNHSNLYEVINTNKNINKNINKRVLSAIYWVGGMWVWVDRYMETAEEVAEYISEPEYCSIFEKIMKQQ